MAEKEKKARFEVILFPTDFSEVSDNAAQYAMLLAKQYRARLHVVHVVDISKEAAGFYLPHISYSKLDSEMRQNATDALNSFVAKNFREYKNIETQVLSGEPYKEIVKYVAQAGADVIVMGTFGKEGLDRMLFGSTTERVMRKVTCPVLVIPPEHKP